LFINQQTKGFWNNSEKEYQSGITFDKSEVENSIKIRRDEILPQWNYSLLSY